MLIIRGHKLVLKDRETSKELATGGLKNVNVNSGDLITVGGKEVELEDRIPQSAVSAGTVFTGKQQNSSLSIAAASSSTTTSFYAPKSFTAPTPFLPKGKTVISKPPQHQPQAGPSDSRAAVSSTAKPLHNPNATGAIVMPRAPKALLAHLNKKYVLRDSRPRVDVRS